MNTELSLKIDHHCSLIWEFPTNRLLQRLPVAKYLAFKFVGTFPDS